LYPSQVPLIFNFLSLLYDQVILFKF
jgi:hypothetical protein